MVDGYRQIPPLVEPAESRVGRVRSALVCACLRWAWLELGIDIEALGLSDGAIALAKVPLRVWLLERVSGDEFGEVRLQAHLHNM